MHLDVDSRISAIDRRIVRRLQIPILSFLSFGFCEGLPKEVTDDGGSPARTPEDGRRLKTKTRDARRRYRSSTSISSTATRFPIAASRPLKTRGPMVRASKGVLPWMGRASAGSYFRRSVTRGDGRRARSPFAGRETEEETYARVRAPRRTGENAGRRGGRARARTRVREREIEEWGGGGVGERSERRRKRKEEGQINRQGKGLNERQSRG